jgi:23S rRNA G2069 N7-methylase RlmK/C1962 C5-methylase RlmI
VVMDFTALPFKDGRFNLVVFDPPHLENPGPRGWQGLKYGKLPKDWRDLLTKGFLECFRVLAPNGTLIFKWNETRIRISEVLSLTPVAPLFGHTTTQSAKTHWMVFMKPQDGSQ